MANEIKLQGVDDLLVAVRAKLQGAAAKVEKNALKAAGEVVAEEMRKRVRVSNRTSQHIRDDIKVSGVRRKDGTKYVLVGPGKKTGWRSHFLEFGTKKMSAHPFVYPAFHEKKGEAMQILADEMRKGLGG